ncbi:PIN domain-containing protein [Pararhodospirillum oryzae]|uniref:type II toxin-antitoxin system VapC family toxin n=1 Tax=Pararhodospirillum oryzae TaxID=478448 RepID=UPI001FEBBD20|nr:type II toxin-antitoxin system VapC family toxin [Pararhodospirillum oryzae]
MVTVHEIERGIATLGSKGATAKAARLKVWLAGLLDGFGDRILGLDLQAAVLSGHLEARALAIGHAPGMADAMVAGIAKSHDLVVITRNGRHFQPFGIAVLSPEEAARRQEGNLEP